jgi:hypothetical protein
VPSNSLVQYIWRFLLHSFFLISGFSSIVWCQWLWDLVGVASSFAPDVGHRGGQLILIIAEDETVLRKLHVWWCMHHARNICCSNSNHLFVFCFIVV